jgi:hypothetical protein
VHPARVAAIFASRNVALPPRTAVRNVRCLGASRRARDPLPNWKVRTRKPQKYDPRGLASAKLRRYAWVAIGTER